MREKYTLNFKQTLILKKQLIMAKNKWRCREFNPTANMEGRSHSFYAEAVITTDLTNDDLADRI